MRLAWWALALAGSKASSEEVCSNDTRKAVTGLVSTSPRLGLVLTTVSDLTHLDAAGAAKIVDAVKQYGVVVIENEPLSRAEQVELSAKLGEVVILPPSFEGLDPEPGQPAIQRVTNYWANGTWKGVRHSFGAYWHQDGQFWPRSHRWIFSMLACAHSPPSGGETGFADLRASYASLDPALKTVAQSASITASVRDIRDFTRNAVPAELDLFDDVEHPVLDTFPGADAADVDDSNALLYVGSPHMRIHGADGEFIPALIDHATTDVYYHAWKPGDVVIWDNTQTLHKAHPYNNTPGILRELYRTQFRVPPSQAHIDRMPGAQDTGPRWLDQDGNVKWLSKDGHLQAVE